MSKHDPVEDALKQHGYTRVKPSVYQWELGKPSTIEHFLFTSIWGGPDRYLNLDFGIRYRPAEDFAIDCIRKFGGPTYGTLRDDPNSDCKMRFPLGKLADWGARWSLSQRSLSSEQVRDRLCADVGKYLVPIVLRVSNLPAFLEVLERNDEDTSWVHVNGAIRAAQIIYLSSGIGTSQWDILDRLRPFKGRIGANLQKHEDTDRFLDDVIHYWNATKSVGSGRTEM